MKVKRNINEIIGERIKNRREQIKLTREELAHRLGYKSVSSIEKIENGKAAIQVFDLIEVSKILRYNIDLLCDTSSAPGVIRVSTKRYGNMMITLNETETNELMETLMPTLAKFQEEKEMQEEDSEQDFD